MNALAARRWARAPRVARSGGGATLAGMAAGNIPRLIETLKTQAGDEKRLACAEAFQIARDLDVPLADVGRTCDELGIKMMQCQLGCF
jgi:hypothetical protein